MRSTASHRAAPATISPVVDHRHRGFVSLNRRQLSLTAAAFACMMAIVPALPASAEPVVEKSAKISSQVLTVDESALQGADRSDFTATEFSEVQAPIPMSTPVSSPFGYRVPPCAGCSSYHQGVDLTPGVGYKIEAIADGTVSEVGNPSGGLGVYIVIDHVIDGQKVSSVYAHMGLGSMNYSVGDTISRGDVVGTVGSTGQSTGPHLYFAIRLGGVTSVEPLAWLRAHINSK